MSKNKLLDKIAIVTGTSSGIGRATALELALNGAHLALASRNVPAMQELANQIQSLGRQSLVVETDVSQQDQVRNLIQQTVDRWGRVDILFSNAGQYIRVPIAELSIQELERSMAVNFYGHVYTVLAVLPHMLRQHSGHIIFNTTMDAKKGLVPDAPYVSAKFAISGFGEVLRQELHGTGVNVTSVYAGRIDTPLIENLKVPWVSAKIPAETVARAVIRGMLRKKFEIFTPPQVLILYYLNVFSPKAGDWGARFFHLQGWEIGKEL